MIPTCGICRAKLAIVDGVVQPCPTHAGYVGGRMYPASSLGEHDAGAARAARPRPCIRNTWCTREEHPTKHEDGTPNPCEVVPQYAIAPSDFGPKAATNTRRGKS